MINSLNTQTTNLELTFTNKQFKNLAGNVLVRCNINHCDVLSKGDASVVPTHVSRNPFAATARWLFQLKPEKPRVF